MTNENHRTTKRRLLLGAIAFTTGVGVMALAAAGFLVRRYSTSEFAKPGPEAIGPTPAASLLPVDPEHSPIVDFSTPGEYRTPIRPRKTVALTFDDGPDPTWTPLVLDVLARHQAKATFFTIGAKALEEPALVRRIRDAGHELGNHTFSHPAMGAIPSWQQRVQLSMANVALAKAGVTTKIMRPPYSGRPDDLTVAELDAAKGAGYLLVLTDHAARDWENSSVEQLVAQATPVDDKGAVITFHDGGGDRRRSVDALDRLLTDLDARGFRYATVSEFAGLEPGAAFARPSIAQRISAWSVLSVVSMVGWVGGFVRYGSLVLIVLGLVRAIMVLTLARRNVRVERKRPPADDSLLPPVSVLVPAFNEAVGIEAAIRSLAASDYPEFEIVVIDDGSTDRTAEIARSVDLPNVRVVSQTNAGKAAALNNGLAHAQHDIVVLIDGDTVFEPGTLRHLVRPLLDPAVGAVGGTVKVGNRKGLLGRWQHIEYVVSCVAERRMFDQVGCVPCVPGAVGAYRRQALEFVGGVPTDTLAEDTDLTIAVQRAGWRVAFAPHARAWTEVPLTYKSLWRQRYRWNYGTLQAIWKNRSAVRERGPGGTLGRFAFPYMLVFSLLFAVLGPLVDIYAVHAIFNGRFWNLLAVWGAVNGLALLVAGYAFRLDGERLRTLWALPLQQFVHRQLMYAVVLASVRSALVGRRLRWHKLARTGLDFPVSRPLQTIVTQTSPSEEPAALSSAK